MLQQEEPGKSNLLAVTSVTIVNRKWSETAVSFLFLQRLVTSSSIDAVPVITSKTSDVSGI